MNEHGDIQQIGTPWDIYERSENEMVFKFMGLCKFHSGEIQNNHHYIGEGNQILNWKTCRLIPGNWDVDLPMSY